MAMNRFPPGSIRCAVAAVGDAWSLLHEPNHQGERNESIVAELRDAQVMRCCDDLCARQARFSMLRRASFGLTTREARELIA
jgi:hypothetical protein